MAGQAVTVAGPDIWEPVTATRWLELNEARAVAGEILGPSSGCYKIGADQASSTLTLRFHFPDVARQRYAEALTEIAHYTGWRVTVHPEPHQGVLQAQAREVLPPGLRVIGAPALQPLNRTVIVRCEGTITNDLEAAQVEFAATTGWRLIVQCI